VHEYLHGLHAGQPPAVRGEDLFTHYEPRLRDNERRVLHGAPLRGGPALHYNGNLVSA
jgi:hypothetical protein